MTPKNYLIFHKDHPMSVTGCNSGAENATLWLARTLAASGSTVVVAGIIPEGTHQRWGVQFIDLGKNFDTSLAFDWVAEKNIEYHLLAACRAIPVMQSINDPLCLTRGFIAHDPSGSATGINAEILSEICDYMVCVSQAQKNLFVEAGAKSEKIHVIPNGADLELFKAGDVNKRNYKKFVFIGALVAHKGIDILVQSFYNITQQHPDAELHVYGSSQLWGQGSFLDEATIQSQVPQIKFHGAVDQTQIAEVLSGAGACIIPSRWFDSFPLTAVEGLVTGCPVIAFDVGGIREAVKHNRNGLLISEVSEGALTKTLAEVASNSNLLKSFSEYALANDRQFFTWTNTADSIAALIEKTGSRSLSVETQTVGYVTTWNQQCGLATYASFLTQDLPKDSYVVFAESSQEVISKDESNVIRCWSRPSDDYSQLQAAVSQSKVKLLHLNCHASFFHYPKFNDFLNWCKQNTIQVVASIHNLFTIEKSLQALLPALDQIYVHCIENQLEAVANGADPKKVTVVPHGVIDRDSLSEADKQAVRRELGLAEDAKLITCFGFVQPHKGMELLIDTVLYLNSKGIKAYGLVCGKPHHADSSAVEYFNALQLMAKEIRIEDKIIFLNRFVSEEEVAKFLGASDVIMMNYRSQHFEASGACSLAVGSKVPVVTSVAPVFAAFGDSVFRATSGYPAQLAVERLLVDQVLNQSLRDKASDYSRRNSWAQITKTLRNNYKKLGITLTSHSTNETQKSDITTMSKENTTNTSSKIKVLLHNRPNTFTQRGGDTVVIEKILENLKSSSVDITVDLEAKMDPKDFDLVHIFNFALPDMVKFYAERALNCGVPYVVTTLLEDIPSFHYQSHYVASVAIEYVNRLQDKQWWSQQGCDYRKIEKAPAFDNKWVAQHAAALFPNGAAESRSLINTYGDGLKITEIPLGHELKVTGSRSEWEKEFGYTDFVFCVGRIETRKNQLMLLKALENDDITVVLAGGGFSYQPEYENAVRNFKRKGKTIILPKLTDQQLANAYAAAKVHALPSWYELPGLVSLEAAYYGCNIVATKNGTSADYLGNDAFYCDPGEEDSIRNAVLAAYHAPRQTNLKEKVMDYSWKEMADKTMRAYQDVSGKAIAAEQYAKANTPTMAVEEGDSVRFQEELERGELLAKDHKFEEALEAFSKAALYGTPNARLCRAQGATLLASGKFLDAKDYFAKAIENDSLDAKSWCGLGMCEAFAGNRQEAYRCQVKSLSLNPENTVAILQLMESAYILNQYEDLEKVLRSYMLVNPNDTEMQFCLAGCLYKAGKLEESFQINEKILSNATNHEGALILKTKLEEANQSKKETQALAVEVEIENVQPKSDLSSTSSNFGALDQQILEVEECKRSGDYDGAQSRIAKLQTETEITAQQQETLQALLGEVLVLSDRFIEAENVYDQILVKNADCARALCGKGALSAAAGNWSVASGYFERALAARPDYDVALAGLGLCAAQSANYENAWNFYERSLKSNGENIRALLGIIETGYVLKRLDAVESAIKKYLESHPADLNFMYSLAGCCFAQGKLQEAIEAIETITLFEPTHQNANELRSMIDRQLQSQSASA